MQSLIDLIQESLAARIDTAPNAAGTLDTLFTRLEQRTGSGANVVPSQLPTCRYLDQALGEADHHRTIAADAARRFAAIEPGLRWTPRSPSEFDPDGFQDNHANAMIVGPNGLEVRDDIWIGASLMAPGTRYPDHAHPPEEVYLALSGGEWRQNQGPWHTPGFGGLVHNPPNVIHSMRSGTAPLLAIWCLLVA